MAARSSSEAVNEFVELLRRSLSCVTTAVLDVRGGYHPSDYPHAATLNNGNPIRLRGSRQLGLLMSLQYYVVEDTGSPSSWVVRTAAYYFALTDKDDREIIAYHWHPAGRSGVTWPHMHLGASISRESTLAKVHLPTGRVSIEQILRMAIMELDVQPLRKDWAAMLDHSQSTFEAQRTWS